MFEKFGGGAGPGLDNKRPPFHSPLVIDLKEQGF